MIDGSVLSAWESFYVIVGSSSAGLTGLMFVVITLIPRERAHQAMLAGSLAAFGFPILVHFCAALLISATLSAPWSVLSHAGAVVAVAGIAGLMFVVIVARRIRRQSTYQTQANDWYWYVLGPAIAYATLAGGGWAVRCHPEGGLAAVGVATTSLLFIGIRNAWDTITYIASTE